jgi:nucleoside diphosphate kinase
LQPKKKIEISMLKRKNINFASCHYPLVHKMPIIQVCWKGMSSLTLTIMFLHANAMFLHRRQLIGRDASASGTVEGN